MSLCIIMTSNRIGSSDLTEHPKPAAKAAVEGYHCTDTELARRLTQKRLVE